MLLPLPLGPVIAVSVPRGILTSMFFRLLWRAPRISINGRWASESIWDLGFGIWDFDLGCFFSFPKSPIPNPKSEIADDWRYVAEVTIVRCSRFTSQSFMNSLASQSSSSGCEGHSPCRPKSSAVLTIPVPK